MTEIIKVEKLNVEIDGNRVLEDINFTVRKGDFVGIIGPNGAGKTTLLRAMLGLVPVRQGQVSLFATPISQWKKLRPRVGYLAQRQSHERKFPLSAADVVATGMVSPEKMFRKIPDLNKKVLKALTSVGMEQFINRPFQDLSGGEQQRILLARALAKDPELLLLDEPGTGLDFPSQQAFIELLGDLKVNKGLTIVLVSHDLLAIASVTDQLVCINRTMHVHGRPADVLRSPHLDEAYRCQFDFLKGTDDPNTGCWH